MKSFILLSTQMTDGFLRVSILFAIISQVSAEETRQICLPPSILPLAVASTNYDPPAGYYDAARPGGIWYTGGALKTALNGVIDNHTIRSYDAARQALQIVDQDPNNTNNIILLYDGSSVTKTWDSGKTWNREHQWPDSLLIGGGGMDSDLFNLRACDPDLNNSRGNMPYGLGTGYWDPNHGAIHRGDCARAVFYMATRYLNLTLVNGQPGTGQMGDLAKLIEWHYQDPVDAFERKRNHLIYSTVDNPNYYQGNRNPYIDYPELLWAIWGTSGDNSKIYLGTTEPAGGNSTASLSFRVMVNQPSPSQTLTLTKRGTTPATYDIKVTGSAASTATGCGQAFIGGYQSRNISAGIATTTTPGLKTGTVIIDNTGLTSAGAGTGSADGDDVISISADVVNKRTLSANMVNFGTLYVNRIGLASTTLSTSGDDHNFTRVSVNAGTYSSGQVSVTVNTTKLMDSNGESLALSVRGIFTTTGTKNGSVALSTSNGALTGEGLTGESANSVLVNYTADVISCPDPFADADKDGDVDLDDFAVMQRCFTINIDSFDAYDALPSPCPCFDATGSTGSPDRAIDNFDLDMFLQCLSTSGPNLPANIACDD